MAITTEGIHAAADALDAEGVKPTLAAVRKRLGGGSFTTISAAMAAWRTSKDAAAALPAPPEEVGQRAAALAAEVWATAAGIAQQRLTGMREELDAERAALEARAAEAAQAADTLAADLETAHAARLTAQTATETLRNQLAAATTAAAVAEAQFQTLTEAVRQERQTLRDEINRAQTAADAARAERDQAITNLTRTQTQARQDDRTD